MKWGIAKDEKKPVNRFRMKEYPKRPVHSAACNDGYPDECPVCSPRPVPMFVNEWESE